MILNTRRRRGTSNYEQISSSKSLGLDLCSLWSTLNKHFQEPVISLVFSDVMNLKLFHVHVLKRSFELPSDFNKQHNRSAHS